MLATTSLVALLGAPLAQAAKKHPPATQHHAHAKKRDTQPFGRGTLTLNRSLMERLQTVAAMVPFTIRLQRPYEAGPGDDVLELNWDTASEAWPLAGTTAPPAASTTNLAGSIGYLWDFGADTTGYATLGTVETVIGRQTSLTASGFPVAVDDGTPCPKAIKSIDATAMTLTSAGVRFGTVNPFSREVSGTIDLRTQIRSQATTCDTTAPASQLASTVVGDPPLPVAFNGKFSVSPGITSDGILRLGILRIDAATMPQRTVYGYVWACTVPTDTDPCNRMRFPVRTKLRSLEAEVLVGDHVPPAPPVP